MKTLYIETNHGHIKLADVTLSRLPRTWGDCKGTYVVARGTVVSSGCDRHRFWATSTREVYPVGSVQDVAVWREPYCCDPAADAWRVSTVTCG